MILSNQLGFQLLAQGEEIVDSDGCAPYFCSKLPENITGIKTDWEVTRTKDAEYEKKREAGLKTRLPISGIALLYNNSDANYEKSRPRKKEEYLYVESWVKFLSSRTFFFSFLFVWFCFVLFLFAVWEYVSYRMKKKSKYIVENIPTSFKPLGTRLNVSRVFLSHHFGSSSSVESKLYQFGSEYTKTLIKIKRGLQPLL